jgi:hypothetical protein
VSGPVNPLPLITTGLPPEAGPEDGETAVIVGMMCLLVGREDDASAVGCSAVVCRLSPWHGNIQ